MVEPLAKGLRWASVEAVSASLLVDRAAQEEAALAFWEPQFSSELREKQQALGAKGGVVESQDRVVVEEASEVRQVSCQVKPFQFLSEQDRPSLVVSLPAWTKDYQLILVSSEAG